MNRVLVRGLVLMGIALLFGLNSFRYQLGDLSRAGAGLFPLIISSILFLIGAITVLTTRVMPFETLDYNVRNISIILLSFVGFALISQFINMLAAIVFLAFFSTLAGTSYSLKRNLKIAIGLVIVAFGFRDLLGLNLPLY
ncbi:tripartite tricarboxylate transporter TctB family protein [Variovorax sp. OV329]|uniref:tripartite tricarboxylate transporter TctB family protein n=1 Tax=Variovorax sp. OV329 TaxID=1882825 RepID=UPI0008EA7B47|nr:tripartite tricarboxylate transporter TctB family protein [Variovorax sp. OV329]SFM05614.1 Tripartite tricarboxylate transporter TctB family protein [Variovorax sp. OV329]